MSASTEPFLGVAASATGRCWRARSLDERLAAALCQRLEVPDIIGRVLAARGVGIEDAEHYLHPTLRHLLPDPSSLPDMDTAARRLAGAIQAGERIAILGDYDVDGATSAALLWRFLDALGQAPLIHIPDRQREGYGPNASALDKLAAAGARLVITVDCGTTAVAALKHARAAGLDVIVVDHHLAEPELPPAAAIVNANRVDVSAPRGLRDLAAVGVAFLLAVAVNRTLREAGWFGGRIEPDLMNLLDLVALGTVADVVPLGALNRALVAQGLKVAARRGNAGLAALADVAKLQRPPDAYHLGFILGPRVNAGGRVGASDLGVRLLTTADGNEARRLAEELDRLNRERQAIENEVYARAMAAVSRDGPLALAAGQGWHQGVIGIVAGRLKEHLHRPALVIAVEGSVGKGSGRSIPGVDLGAAVTAARQAGLLINGGGHPMAAGLTVEAGKIGELGDFLGRRLAAAATERIGAAAELRLDGALAVGGVTANLCDVIAQAGPYGAGNSEPRFAIPATRLVVAEVVGGQHVRCVLAAADGARLKAIAFRGMDGALGPALLNAAKTALPWHVAGRLRAEEWRGERRVQFVIEDAAAA